MKKLFLIIALVVMGITTKAQAVSDMAVIPIGVTLNSIARLTVTSGGNIEFVVNTMDQYKNGVATSAATTTTFSVACSNGFAVTVQSDLNDLTGTVDGTKKMSSKFIAFKCKNSTSKTVTVNESEQLLSTTEAYIVGSADTWAPADTYSGFQVEWSLKPTAGDAKLTDMPSDRYVINAYLQLKQQTKTGWYN